MTILRFIKGSGLVRAHSQISFKPITTTVTTTPFFAARSISLLSRATSISYRERCAVPSFNLSGVPISSQLQSSQRHVSTIPNTTKRQPFQNISAPSFDSLPKPPKKKEASTKKKEKGPRKSRFLRVSLGLLTLGVAGYIYDANYNAYAVTRTLRTAYVMAEIAIDYKLNFAEGKDIQALHLRSADKIYDLMVANKGLYIKMGQAVAVQAAIFPPAFQRKFARLFDNAPADTWDEIRNTVREEYGKEPEDVFDEFDKNAIASASIAQVYKARLKGTGEKVAVKIQHTDIPKQIDLDLKGYRTMMWIYEKIFDMPLYFLSKYVTGRMLLEVNFLEELENSETTRENVEKQWGKGDFPEVYIPKVYKDLTTKRIMVTEWIDGVSLSDKDSIRASGFDVPRIIGTVLTLFSKQIFEWGAVHCDPHPGNIIVRSKPGFWFQKPRQQIVLIDHGLYVYTPPKFRAQYSQLWKSMFLLDRKTIQSIMASWGIGSEELFTSSIMLKPSYTMDSSAENLDGEGSGQELTRYQMQEKMKERLKNFIVDATHMPLQLVFLGRSMNLLAGLNRMYGSPVNRVKIMAYEASRSSSIYNAMNISIEGRYNELTPKPISSPQFANPFNNLIFWTSASWDYAKFRFVVALSDLAFAFFRLRQFFIWNRSSRDKKGMEDYIEDQMLEMANKMGFEIEKGKMFSG